MLMSPENVEVAVGLKLINEAPDCIERAVPGEVVPIPRLPVSANLPASVRSPDLKVEKSKSPFPVLKFWVRSEVMAGVEVAPEIEEVAETVPKTGEVVAERVKV